MDFGSDYVHDRTGIARGTDVYTPLNVLQDPNHYGLMIAIEPVRMYEEVISSAVINVIEMYTRQGYEFNESKFKPQALYAAGHIRHWMGDSDFPLFKPFQDRIPPLEPKTLAFMAAGQAAYQHLFKKTKAEVVERIRNLSPENMSPPSDTEIFLIAQQVMVEDFQRMGPLSRLFVHRPSGPR
jgi:hypothetical protein